MKSLPPFALALLVAACSSTHSTTAPTSCNHAERVGTYRFTFVEQSGNCGPLDSQLVSLNSGPMGVGTGCVVNSEVWSDNDCKLERDVTCPAMGGGTVRVVAVTRDQAAHGSELAGTESFTLSGPDSCDGTYAIDAVRQ